MKKQEKKVNLETMALCIGISDLYRKKGRLDLSIKYDLLVKDKLHLEFKQLVKLTMDFTLENDIQLIDSQTGTSKNEKDNQVNTCIDHYASIIKRLRE